MYPGLLRALPYPAGLEWKVCRRHVKSSHRWDTGSDRSLGIAKCSFARPRSAEFDVFALGLGFATLIMKDNLNRYKLKTKRNRGMGKSRPCQGALTISFLALQRKEIWRIVGNSTGCIFFCDDTDVVTCVTVLKRSVNQMMLYRLQIERNCSMHLNTN
jgi:hypothetical protein